MKVVHWNMRYYPLLGGIETHVDTLIRHMPDIQFEIVTDALPGTARTERYRPNATILRFPPVDRSRVSRHWKLAVPVAAIRDSLREARERKYLRNADYDLLHVHDFEKNLVLMEDRTKLRFVGRLAGRLHDLQDFPRPRLLTKHFMFTEENAVLALRKWEERLVKQFETVVCVDKAIERRYSPLEGPKEVLFIPNPIDTEQFSYAPLPEEETLHLGYVGRLAMARGENLLFDVANRLPSGTDLRIAVQHPGGRLADVMKALGGERVQMELDVPYDSMPKFLQGIHILVNPVADAYSTTRVTLESMAVGRPVIMFNTGERYPMRHGENGFLVDPDVQSICRLVESVKSDRENLGRISKKAREDVEKEFAAPLIASKIRRLYGELAGSA